MVSRFTRYFPLITMHGVPGTRIAPEGLTRDIQGVGDFHLGWLVAGPQELLQLIQRAQDLLLLSFQHLDFAL